MPITDVIEADDSPDGVTEHAGRVFAALMEHVGEVRMVKAWRARTAKVARRSVPPAKAFAVNIDEDPTDLCRKTANAIMDVIALDAAGEPWRGEVELLGELDAKGKAPVLTSVDVKLAGGAPQPKPTRDDEMIGSMSVLRETIKGLGEQCVRIASTKADELAAYVSMVQSVATMVTGLSKTEGKWAYKMHRETEETARVVEEQRSKAQRSANFWNAFETWSEEWSGVAEIWSTYFAAGNKELPKRPTLDELQRVFDAPDMLVDGRPFSEIYDPIRAKIAEMLAETDVKRRLQMAKDELGGERGLINQLTENERAAMKLRIVAVLGQQRAGEVAAWLTMPLT